MGMFGTDPEVVRLHDRVLRLERLVEAIAAHLGVATPADPVDEEIAAHIAAGRHIQAVRRYREATGASLSAAKAHVDGLRDAAR